MSFQAMSWAVEQKVPALQKLVLLMLANHTNGHTGRCDPSMARLCDECGMKKDALIGAIKALEAAGLVSVVRRKLGDVSLRNCYRLAMPGVDVSTPVVEVLEVEEVPRGVVGQTDYGSRPDRLGVVGQTDRKQEVQPVNKPTSIRGSRLPADFAPNDTHARLAHDSSVDLTVELAQFKDYHTAKGTVMKDWDAALRTWLRNSAKWRKPSGTKGAGWLDELTGKHRTIDITPT